MAKLVYILSVLSVFAINGYGQAATSILPGGHGNWKLSWADEFDYPDAQLDANWNSANGPQTWILCSRWRENAVVSDGTLKLVNKKESRGGQEWTSGSIWTKKQFQYGYFECRYRYAAATGTNNSFWIMTTGNAPAIGKKFEIDINEGHYPAEMATNLHNWTDITTDPVTGKSTHPSSGKSFNIAALKPGSGINLGKEFHTYGLLWNKDSLIYYFDGNVMRRMKNEFCFSSAPVYLSEAIIPWAGEVTDAINGTQMEVDYVRIYEPLALPVPEIRTVSADILIRGNNLLVNSLASNKIEIFNSAGLLISAKHIPAGESTVRIDSPGIYIARVSGGQTTFSKKIMIR